MYHPDYDLTTMHKHRIIYDGGRTFVDNYLSKFDKREYMSDFYARRNMAYSPAAAKTAILEMRDAIFQRLVDIRREGGPVSYVKAVAGQNGGVDLNGTKMTTFVGQIVLPELLAMGAVGICIDRATEIRSRLDETSPYLYIYKKEDILNWRYENGKLSALYLRRYLNEYDDMGLPKGVNEQYRYYSKTNDGIIVKDFDRNENEIDSYILNLNDIPFVISKIKESLMTDVSDHQIALLNLASSDLNYALKSNFPFYTEQYDVRDMLSEMLASGNAIDEDDEVVSEGTETEANTAKTKEINIGVSQGRRYPIGAERPAYIHPSSEPLMASMEKQERIKNMVGRFTIRSSFSNCRTM